MSALGKLTPHQSEVAHRVLPRLARMDERFEGPEVHPRARGRRAYAVAVSKATPPSPGDAASIIAVGSAGALNRLRLKGYLEAVETVGRGYVAQEFYRLTPDGSRWAWQVLAARAAERDATLREAGIGR